MATKLSIWNDALRRIGGYPLADTTTVNAQQKELAGAWDASVEYTLARVDWTFARRRASPTTVSDTTGYPPFTYRHTRPSDYLRKVWLKSAADDEFQVSHAEIAAVIYSFTAAPVLEYMSDHADNYDPANWPTQFARVMSLYLALLVGPKLGRIGDGEVKTLYSELDNAIGEAIGQESVFTVNTNISTERITTMRRALEFVGHNIVGTTATQSQTDMLRWKMNKTWDHAVKHVLSQGAWNFAAKRAVLLDGEAGDTNIPTESIVGITEGYSVDPATDEDETNIAGYDYSYELPTDFLHKIWLKASPHHAEEIPHQRLGNYMFCDYDSAIMEYVAYNSYTYDPDNWPPLFLDAVAAFLAVSAIPDSVTVGPKGGNGAALRQALEANWQRRLSDAKNKDAIQQYPHQMPLGNFARARMGNGYLRLARTR